MVDTIVEFIAGASPKIRSYVRDENGALVDPSTSIKITVTDPVGTVKVDAQAMTKFATGIYDYYVTTLSSSEKGWWYGEVTVVDSVSGNPVTSKGVVGFELK